MNQNGTALMTNLAEALQAAWRHHQAGDRRRAEQLYRDILRADPTCADAWCFLAALCHAEGRLAEAEEYLQRALQRVPHYQAAQQLLGIVLASKGAFAKRKRSSATCSSAIQTTPRRTIISP